jgi:hypothetical protein
MALSIPGLPDGVVCAKIGIAKPDEYELTRSPTGDCEITKGPRGGSTAQIIVEPDKDHEFIFDIRSLTFRPVKKLAAPVDIVTTIRFRVTNEVDQGRIQDGLKIMTGWPGFVEMK